MKCRKSAKLPWLSFYIFDFLSSLLVVVFTFLLFNLLSFLLLFFRLVNFLSFVQTSLWSSCIYVLLPSNPPECQDWGKGGGGKPIWTIPSFWEFGEEQPLSVHQYRCIWFYPGESKHPDERNKTILLHTKWKNFKNLGACPSFLFHLWVPSHLICVKIVYNVIDCIHDF